MKMILFDFDGVLVDTLDISYNINSEVNEAIPLDSYKDLFHGNIYEALKDSTKIKNHPNFFERYEEHTRKLEIPEPIKNLIKKLSESYKLAIVSSTPAKLISDILIRESMADYFADIFGNEMHESKVVKIKHLLEKYKVVPEDVVFVTDTVGDIKEAAECGVKSIGVTWGFHEEARLLKAKPAKVVNTPEDLAKAIAEIL